MQVVAVGGEVVGQQVERRGKLAGGGQVVDRLDQRPAEQQGPDAVDRGAGEVRVRRVDDPGGELLARAARGRAAARDGTARAGSTVVGSLVLRSSGLYVLSPSRMPRRLELTPPKNAARPWKSACFQGWNGWSWHWAQSSRTPRNARATRAASRSGSGRSVSGSKVTVTKLVAGWSVQSPWSAIRSRTIAS